MIKTRKQLRAVGVRVTNGYRIKNKRGDVTIYDDGDILRNDVRADLAMLMTVKAAVKYLGL